MRRLRSRDLRCSQRRLLVQLVRGWNLLRCCCGHSLNHVQQVLRGYVPVNGWRPKLHELQRGPVLWEHGRLVLSSVHALHCRVYR